MKKYKEKMFVVLGFICLALGIIGAMMPVVPTVPFLFVAYICFRKGSKKFKRWYERSKYHKYYTRAVNKFMSKPMALKVLYILGMIIFFSCLFYFWYYIYANYFDMSIDFVKGLLNK